MVGILILMNEKDIKTHLKLLSIIQIKVTKEKFNAKSHTIKLKIRLNDQKHITMNYFTFKINILNKTQSD